MESAQADAGEHIDVALYLADVMDFGSITVRLNYDSSVVAVDNISAGNVPSSTTSSNYGNPGSATILVQQASLVPGPSGTFVIVHVGLRAVGANGTTSQLGLVVEEFVDTNGENIAHDVVSGNFTISPGQTGPPGNDSNPPPGNDSNPPPGNDSNPPPGNDSNPPPGGSNPPPGGSNPPPGPSPYGLRAGASACDEGSNIMSGVVRVASDESFNATDVYVIAVMVNESQGESGGDIVCIGPVVQPTGTVDAFTGESGVAFSATNLSVGSWVFLAWNDKDGDADYTPSVETSSQGESRNVPPDATDLDLLISPGQRVPGSGCDATDGGMLYGNVTNKQGVPLEGQNVFLNIRPSAGGPEQFTFVDENGSFSCALSPGSFTVEAHSPDAGFGFEEFEMTQGGVIDVTLALGFDTRPPYSAPTVFYGATAWGNVTVGDAGASGVRVGVFPAHDPTAAPGPAQNCEPGDPSRQRLSSCGGEGQTDANGTFVITGLGNGTYDMFIDGANANPPAPSRFFNGALSVSNANNTTVLTIDLGTFSFAAPATIAGRVVTMNGDPIADAEVNAWPQCEPNQPCDGGGWGRTDQDGNYSLVIAPGNYSMYVRPASDGPAYSPARLDCYQGSDGCVTVVAGQSVFRNFTLAAGATLSGRVLDGEGTPVRAFINAHSCPPGPGECKFGWGETAWNRTGYFSVTIEPGTYEVRVEPDQWERSDLSSVTFQNVIVAAGETIHLNDGLPIVLGAGSAIEGYVLTPDGDPVASVNLFANVHNDDPNAPHGGGGSWAFTDENGHYRLGGLTAGSWDVFAEPPYGTAYMRTEAREVVVTEGATASQNLTLTSGGTLAGYVLTADGLPIADANVDAFWHPEVRGHQGPGGSKQDFPASGGWGHARTDANGYYEIAGLTNGTFGMFVNPPPGTSYTNAHLDPYQDDLPLVDIGATTYHNFTLGTGGQITGCVEASESPVAFAWVSAHSRGGFGGGEPTQQDGCFTIRGVQAGTYSVEVQPPHGAEFGRTTVNNVIVGEGQTVDVGTITLSEGIRLAGRVLDANGDPVSGASVNAWQHHEGGPDAGPGAFGFAITNADGIYNISGLVAGKYGMHIEPPYNGNAGLSSKFIPEVRLGESGRFGYDITLGGGGWITGRVVGPDAQPISGAWVGAWSHEGQSGSGSVTGADGTFNLTGLEPATDYNFDVSPPWDRANLAGFHAFPLTVADGEGNDQGDLSLATGGTVKGRVVDSEGDGVAFAFINVNGDGTFGWGMTDDTGNFSVQGIRATSGDTLFIHVEPPFGSSAVGAKSAHTWAPDEASESDAGTLTLGAGVRITGRIMLNGEPVADADVFAWPTLPYNGPPIGGSATTSASGWYNITGLPSDQAWDIRVEPGAGIPGSFEADAVTTSGDVAYYNATLSDGATLSVRVTDGATTSAVANAFVECQSSGQKKARDTDAFGYANFTGAPEGSFTCKAYAPGYRANVDTATIGAGDVGSTVSLEISLAAVTPGSIFGNFTPTTGNASGYLVVVVPVGGTIGATDVTGFNRTGDTGSFIVPDMPPATYEVRILDASGTVVASKLATVTSGDVDAGEITQGTFVAN